MMLLVPRSSKENDHHTSHLCIRQQDYTVNNSVAVGIQLVFNTG